MFKKLLGNTTIFTVLYFSILLLDILVKFNLTVIPYRLISKPLLVLVLIAYYSVNMTVLSVKKHKFMLTALIMFLIGDVFLIFKGMIFLGLGMLFFLNGKLFYALRFLNNKDFSAKRALPFLAVCTAYIVFIMSYVYSSLNLFFIPVIVYLFVALIEFLFAYLRKEHVNKRSYYLVFFGVLFSIFSDTTVMMNHFSNFVDLDMKGLVMVLYGIAQYLIVRGVVEERMN